MSLKRKSESVLAAQSTTDGGAKGRNTQIFGSFTQVRLCAVDRYISSMHEHHFWLIAICLAVVWPQSRAFLLYDDDDDD